MAPEMKNDLPNGLKADIWSFAILIGVILGLDQICPVGYRGGVPGFIKNCASSKHDMDLHKA